MISHDITLVGVTLRQNLAWGKKRFWSIAKTHHDASVTDDQFVHYSLRLLIDSCDQQRTYFYESRNDMSQQQLLNEKPGAGRIRSLSYNFFCRKWD